MKFLPGQLITVRHNDQDFHQIIAALREDTSKAHATLIALIGPKKSHLELAAEEFAASFGMNLYRVDLQAIIGKYIGETEKNLRQLFERASGAGSMLFFDEADALFGRRTEVRDAHDRFASLETNYLLELLKKHQEIVIAIFSSAAEAKRSRKGVRQLVVEFSSDLR